MMEFTTPTPLAAHFPPFPAVAAAPYEQHAAPWSIPAMSAPDSAPSADFFAQALSSSPSSSSTSSLEAYLPPPPFALTPAPAPLVVTGGLSDAWMDDTFYENLFGSLGLDLASAGQAAAPGLTLSLSLEAVRAEEMQVQVQAQAYAPVQQAVGGGGEMWF